MKCFILLYLLCLTTLIASVFGAYKKSSEGEVLSRILENYDKHVKPPTGNSTEVKVDTFVRSIKNICSIKQEITVQLAFRAKWFDPRLNFQQYSVLTYITIIDKNLIWIPDLFVSNAVHATELSIVRPNVAIRIFGDGTVFLSDNVLFTLSCPMNLKAFPFDTQNCPIHFASYAYKKDELMVKWNENPPAVQINPKLNIPNFALKNYWHKDGHSKTTNTGSYSYIELTLQLKRESTYYLLNIYLPSAMLVIISWMSFWVDVKQQTLKSFICLGSLITLSLSLLILNHSLPHPSYTMTLDCWTGVCLTFVFFALVQSIIVHYRSIKKSSTNENQMDKHIVTNDTGLLVNNEFVKKYLPFLIDSKSDRIDCLSRCLFPILFLLFVVVYFIVCLT